MKHLLEHPLSVVGNAESIFQKERGELIDRFTTIRFNRADIINERCQGSRWDFLVSSEVNTFEKYNNENPKFHTLVFTPTKREMQYKIGKIKFDTNIIKLPIEQSIELERLLSSPPSTGLQMLYFLDSIKNGNVEIFGFDFKETRTFYETRNKGQHDFAAERDFVMRMVKKNGWTLHK
jgi:hypothetical protein